MTSRALALAAAALVVVGLVIVLLLDDDGSDTPSPYVRVAEQRCKGANLAIERVDRQVRSLAPAERSARRAESVFEIVGEMRAELLTLPVEKSEGLQATTFAAALLEAEKGLILVRNATWSGSARLPAQTVQETATAMGEVRSAAQSLDLPACARLEIFALSG